MGNLLKKIRLGDRIYQIDTENYFYNKLLDPSNLLVSSIGFTSQLLLTSLISSLTSKIIFQTSSFKSISNIALSTITLVTATESVAAILPLLPSNINCRASIDNYLECFSRPNKYIYDNFRLLYDTNAYSLKYVISGPEKQKEVKVSGNKHIIDQNLFYHQLKDEIDLSSAYKTALITTFFSVIALSTTLYNIPFNIKASGVLAASGALLYQNTLDHSQENNAFLSSENEPICITSFYAGLKLSIRNFMETLYDNFVFSMNIQLSLDAFEITSISGQDNLNETTNTTQID
jgi:hypothetical protein